MNKKWTKWVLEYLIVILVGLVDAVSYTLFVVNNFIPMGFNGIAVMIEYKTHFEGGWFSWFSLIVNLPFCIFTFFFVDKDFAVKSYLYIATLALGYLMFKQTSLPQYAINCRVDGTDYFIPLIASATISGIIYSIVFRINGSTGGMDVVGKIISHKFPEVNFLWASFSLCAFVALSSYFVMDNGLSDVVLCITFSFLAVFIGNYILKESRGATKVEIVTKHAQEINDRISSELHHTTTLIKAQGMYKRTEYELLICVLNKRQIVDLETILKDFPDTFAYTTQVASTFGLFNKPKKYGLQPKQPKTK